METFSVLLALSAGNSPVTGEFPHKGQWREALMFSLICTWINGWVNNREAGDLRLHHANYDVTVMSLDARPSTSKMINQRFLKVFYLFIFFTATYNFTKRAFFFFKMAKGILLDNTALPGLSGNNYLSIINQNIMLNASLVMKTFRNIFIPTMISSAYGQRPGPRLNIKTVLSTYGDFHVKDKTAVRTSYL